MNFVIIGVGLIGGSLGMKIKELYPNALIQGVDKKPENITKAIALGLIDKKSEEKDFENADYIIVATTVDTIGEIVKKRLDNISEKTLIIDMGSTKYAICKFLESHPKRNQFLASHPIAGTEFSGPEAASKELFSGKINIICEKDKTDKKLLKKGKFLFKSLKMNLVYMNPKAHDLHIAYVSHLSHVSSFILSQTVLEKEKNEKNITNMAGSGFESTVRLAKSSPYIWKSIFKENRGFLLEALNDYIINLQAFKEMMERSDFSSVEQSLKKVNRIKEILKNITTKELDDEKQ